MNSKSLPPQSADPRYAITDNKDNARHNETRNNKRDTRRFEDNNHYNKSNYESNKRNIKNHSKKVRRSKKKKLSNNKIKILYANDRGLKLKLRDIKMILFETEPDIAAFWETNLKTQEKIAISGYTWAEKNRQHKEGGVGYFIKNLIKKSCIVEQGDNTTTEILWMKLKLKRQENLFAGVLYGKQESKHCIKELEEEYEVIERSVYNYTKTNNKIILVGDFNGK